MTCHLCEALDAKASSGWIVDDAIFFANTNFENGIGKVSFASTAADFETYLPDVSLAGVYEVKVHVKKGPDSGRFRPTCKSMFVDFEKSTNYASAS